MKIEIDQSGKIEDTNRLTVIAFSNDHSKSLLITAKDKKSIQSIFRKINQPRIFISQVFAAAVYYIAKDELKNINTIIIDNEYPGHEKYIKKLIIKFFENDNIKTDKVQIHFRSIGKKSKAHNVAYKAFKIKRASDKLTSKQILQIVLR